MDDVHDRHRLASLEEQLVEEVAGSEEGELQGTLEIGASTGPGGSVMATLLCEFQERNPGVHVALSVFDTQDVTSQVLTLSIVATGGEAMSELRVLFENVSLGSVPGPFEPGVARSVSFGVPTTISVTLSQSYPVVVEGVYGQQGGEYWQSIEVFAG